MRTKMYSSIPRNPAKKRRDMISKNETKDTSRRGFLRDSGQIAAASALAAGLVPHVHAAEDSTIQLALVGCGVVAPVRRRMRYRSKVDR